jgi:hypothetical protein
LRQFTKSIPDFYDVITLPRFNRRGSYYGDRMNNLINATKEALAALDEAEQTFTPEGRMREAYICDHLADFCYAAHDILKAQGRGRESEANAFHRQGNRYWSRVVEILDDGKPPPKKYVLR